MSRYRMHNRIARYLTPVALLVLAGLSAFAQDADKRITMDLKGAALDSVLQTLMTQAGVNYIVSPEVDLHLTVSASFANIRFEDALRALLRSCNLTYSLDPGGIYVIRQKTESLRPRESGAAAPDTAQPPAAVVADDGVHVEKIKLLYTDPYDIWAILTDNGKGNAYDIHGMTGLMPYLYDNSLIAKFGGTPFWGGGAGVAGRQPQIPGQGNGMQGGWPNGRGMSQGGNNGYGDMRGTGPGSTPGPIDYSGPAQPRR